MVDRKVFTDSVTPLPDHPQITPHGLMVNFAAAPDAAEKLHLHFALAIPPAQAGELEAAVAAGKIVDRDKLSAGYGPDKAKVDRLTDWLKGQGFAIEDVSPDGTSVYVAGTIGQIEKSLAVKMVPVVRDGITYPAAQNAPSLPADVGEPVHAIVGLQPFRQANKHRARVVAAANRADVDGAGQPTPDVADQPPYMPSEMLTAYGAAGLGLTGKGQTVAILIDTLPNDSDLQAFWRACGLNVGIGQVTKINIQGGPLPADADEVTLDASWITGIAPDAAVRIYAAGNLGYAALNRALDRIVADMPKVAGLNQLSISLGAGEQYLSAVMGDVRAQHQKFLKLAAGGVNVFVSTGDAGSNPDTTGHSPTGPLQAEYSSTDTAVIAVGGTTLTLGPGGAAQSEVAWSMGGGGESIIFPRQLWQTGTGVPAGHDRLVPDVCAAADPSTGAFLIVNGQPMTVGGTSWSTPMWAGFCALINEARHQKNLTVLPYANALLYPLLGSPCFRDVVSGSNGAYHATPGYDLVSGLGAPQLAALVTALTK